MLVLGIILIACVLFALIGTHLAKEESTFGGFALGFLFLFGVLIIVTTLSGRVFHSKDYSLMKQVIVESVNGVETSRDTIYIFTPRKEESNHNLSRRVCK